jgi:hypothetical protein
MHHHHLSNIPFSTTSRSTHVLALSFRRLRPSHSSLFARGGAVATAMEFVIGFFAIWLWCACQSRRQSLGLCFPLPDAPTLLWSVFVFPSALRWEPPPWNLQQHFYLTGSEGGRHVYRRLVAQEPAPGDAPALSLRSSCAVACSGNVPVMTFRSIATRASHFLG